MARSPKTARLLTPACAESIKARERSALSTRPDICQQPTYLITGSKHPYRPGWTKYAIDNDGSQEMEPPENQVRFITLCE